MEWLFWLCYGCVAGISLLILIWLIIKRLFFEEDDFEKRDY